MRASKPSEFGGRVNTMKAVQIVEIGAPLEMREVPIPVPGPGDVLVRVMAAGVCHSDVHYRSGLGTVGTLPHTPGHEVSGIIESVGPGVEKARIGERVALHYLVTCGDCVHCRSGREQFCEQGNMIGKDIAGGYAEFISIPAWNAIPMPDEVSFEHAAIMMCSTATVYHALRKGRIAAGERVAIFGVGGLGLSAVQLARLCGATEVYAVDIDSRKLELAEALGGIPINASEIDPVEEIQQLCSGVDVSLELIGLPQTMRQAVESLGIHGRAVLVGLAGDPLCIDTYGQILGKEAEILGCSDHLRSELPILLEYARQQRLDFSRVVEQTITLEAQAINNTMDALEAFHAPFRTVIVNR